MRRWIIVMVATAFVMMTIPALAHHSFTNFYRMEDTVEITGVVKSLRLSNPHCQLVVTVTDAKGVKTDWTIISTGTGTSVQKAGWTVDTLPVGTKVKVSGHPPRRQGSPALAAGKITRPDGSEIWFGGGGGIPVG